MCGGASPRDDFVALVIVQVLADRIPPTVEGVTTPRYVPRAYIAPGYQTLFGKTPSVPWTPQDSRTHRERLEAARMQHLYAVVIRDRIKKNHSSIRAYAAAAGQDEQRLARVLRGQTVMRLDDIGTAIAVVGDIHGPALSLLVPRLREDGAR